MEEKEEKKENRLIFRLNDPFMFDGEEVKIIDMEGLVDLTAADLCALDLMMQGKGYTGRMDTHRQYALWVAAKINHKPYEFCDRMKARDSIRLRNMVTAFFYAGA